MTFTPGSRVMSTGQEHNVGRVVRVVGFRPFERVRVRWDDAKAGLSDVDPGYLIPLDDLDGDTAS
jgi:hypothetical protein